MNGYTAVDMTTTAANGHRDGYQAGYADAVKAMDHIGDANKMVGAAQEAAWELAQKVRTELDRASCPDAFMRIAVEAVMEHAAAPVAAAPVVENVAEDSYYFMADLLEPFVCREGLNPDGELPASAVESFQMLLEHWEKTKVSTPAAPGIDLTELRARVVSAIERITSGAGQMRVPADMTDPDLVLGDVLTLLDSLGPQIDASPKGGSDACIWTDDGEGNWATACGEIFTLIEGVPAENKVHHCPYCGKNLQATSAEVGA